MNKFSLLSLAVFSVLAGCGGSSNDNAAPAKTPITGVFLDGAVENLDYVAGTAAKASTSAKGEFTCYAGDTVAFSVGGIALGSAACAATITPLQLAGVTDVKDAKVVNRLLALQLLDEDSDPSNGIKLTADVKTALAAKSADFNADAATFNTAMSANLAAAGAKYAARTVDDSRRALVREHFEDSGLPNIFLKRRANRGMEGLALDTSTDKLHGFLQSPLTDGNTLAMANDNDFGLKTKIFTPAGVAVEDADVTKCNVDASGAIITSSAAGCTAGNTIRVARGEDRERPSRLWLIKFAKPLTAF